ncbi:MAG: DUF697 domain-containing protein, partial [Alphaproteobacteria bacterium]
MSEKNGKRRGPVVIETGTEEGEPERAGRPRDGSVMLEAGELPEAPAFTPETAPPVSDAEPAMPRLIASAATPPRGGWFGRLVGWAFSALVSIAVASWAWDFVLGLFARNIWLGRVALVLLVIVLIGLAGFVLREIAALSRLARVDRLRDRAAAARAGHERDAVEAFTAALGDFYAGRRDVERARQRVTAEREALLDADALLDFAERSYFETLDARAAREIEAAARQVAVITAMVPLALADVTVALVTNLRMIRRIAAIYGGRAGSLGSLRLMRAVATHLVATGAVAVGDDMLGAVLGGGVVARLSRRFGEGVVNAALTARVGAAAVEV